MGHCFSVYTFAAFATNSHVAFNGSSGNAILDGLFFQGTATT